MIKQLFGNRVAIKPIVDEKETTESGIILTNKKGTKKLIGKVLSIGKGLILPDGSRAPIDVQPGMTVIYKQYAGIQINDTNGEEILVMDAGDIIAEV
jgi:chaperonin 10 Kd subunit